METQQNQSQPQNPPAGAPNNPARSGDLYAAITAEDEAPVEVKEKKHTSPFMALVVAFMKLTFWLDLTRRSNENVFKILKGIWGCFIGLLYLSGIITLFLCLVTFIRLPAQLENFFDDQNIKYSSLEMVDYSLSQIDIKDLHDENNTYQVPLIHIRSTFSDFLKNRILGIEAEGVRINFNPSQSEKNELKWLMNIFSSFNNNTQKFDINALNISKAVLTIMGKNITLPIAFSVVGDYTQGERITAVLFNINEEFLTAEGNLSISGEGIDRKVEMTIKSGTLRLPSSPEETLEGKVVIKISENDIQSIEGTLNLAYAHTKKEILLNTQKGAQGFSGELFYLLKNSANQTEETLIDMGFSFKNLTFDAQQNLTTSAPLTVRINRFNQNNLFLSDMESTLNGILSCSLSGAKCTYELDKKSDLTIGVVKNNYKDQTIVFNDNKTISLYPKGKPTFMWQLNPFVFQANLTGKNIDAYGYLNDEKKALSAMIQYMDLESSFGGLDNLLSLKIEEGYFTSPNWQLDNVSLTSPNLFDTTTPLNIVAENVKTTSPLLKKPFTLNLTTLTDKSVIEMKVKNTDIKLKAQGNLDPLKGTFVGQFVLYPFHFENLTFSLNELSDLFAPSLTNVSGTCIARGQIRFLGNNSIAGPMYLGLKDVHFQIKDTTFTNLNTVMVLQSLKPIQSASNQPFFIEKIQSFFNLYNLSGTFQLTNKNIRFNGVEAQLSNQNLFLNSAIIPLENMSGLFYFKSEEAFSTTNIAPFLTLKGIKISDGLGTLAITVSISPNEITLPSLTLKFSDASLTPKKDEKDPFGLFTNGQTRYFVRNGVFTQTKQNLLQADLDGWYLPYSQKKSFSQKDIPLSENLFQESEGKALPPRLEKLLNQVFH